MRPGTKAAPTRASVVCFLLFWLLPSLTIVALTLVHSLSSPSFFWSSSSRGLESVVRWYARGIVQLFLADALTVCYTGPAIESPVRDVTPPEMATSQAQPTTFSCERPEYQIFERLYSIPPFPLSLPALQNSLPEIARGCASGFGQPGMSFLETETIGFTNNVHFSFLTRFTATIAS